MIEIVFEKNKRVKVKILWQFKFSRIISSIKLKQKKDEEVYNLGILITELEYKYFFET